MSWGDLAAGFVGGLAALGLFVAGFGVAAARLRARVRRR